MLRLTLMQKVSENRCKIAVYRLIGVRVREFKPKNAQRHHKNT